MSACYPVDLYLISEKSIWKNQLWPTGFLVYFKLDFYCLCNLQKSILKLILNWFLKAKNPVCRTWFLQLDFSKIKYRSTGGVCESRKGAHFALLHFSSKWANSSKHRNRDYRAPSVGFWIMWFISCWEDDKRSVKMSKFTKWHSNLWLG